MNTYSPHRPSRVVMLGIGLCLLVITLFHYLTNVEAVASHNIYRRLYYLPIVWAAFSGGLPWGLLSAGIATAAYIPHAFFLHNHHDPAPEIDKILEIVLYFGVGGLSGWLVGRERAAQRRESDAAMATKVVQARAERLAGLVHLSRGLAHEIRNPLGGIQGSIEILADAIPEGNPRRDMVEVGLKEVARLNSVLSHFLEFARPKEPHIKVFPASQVVLHVIELFTAEARRLELTLRTQELSSLELVRADPEQVTQVLVNLVQNAMQATPPGGVVELGARIIEQGGNRRMLFEVSDSGRGVAPELGDSIYDPYVSGREAGTGLGLSISSLLVRQHGGTLYHHARLGGGTVFGFDLDLEPGVGP